MGITINNKIKKNVTVFLVAFLETIYIYNLTQLSEKELFWIIFLGGVIVNSKICLGIKAENKLYTLLSFIISSYISFAFYIGKLSWKVGPDDFLTWKNLLISICGVPFIWIMLIHILNKLNSYQPRKGIGLHRNEELKKNRWILISICIFICWLPVLVINYPGIIISDYTWQYFQALGQSELSNHHPVIHTLIIRFSQWLSSIIYGYVSAEKAVLINSILQMIVMAGIIGYILMQIAREALICSRYVKVGVLILGLYYALFPMNSLFSIYMTKDIIFSGCCFLWSFWLYRDIKEFDSNHNKANIKSILEESIIAILIIYFRSNGFVIVFGTLLLAIVYKKKLKILYIILGVTLIAWIMQTPLLNAARIPKTELVEALGMPINQVANVVNHNDCLTEQEKELIENVMPLQVIKETYNERYSDPLKFNSQFNGRAIEQNRGEYLKLWMKLFIKYPKDYLEASLNLTIGYWYPGVDKGCISYNYDTRTQFFDQLEIANYSVNTLYKHFLTAEVRQNMFEAAFWSPGLAVMILLILLLLCVGQAFYDLVLMFLPTILGWGSLLIATPSYCETRYVYFIFLTLPVIIVCMLIEKEKKYGQDCSFDTML